MALKFTKLQDICFDFGMLKSHHAHRNALSDLMTFFIHGDYKFHIVYAIFIG